MGDVILYEDPDYRRFLPLVYWRPVQRLRVGRGPMMAHIAQRLDVQRVGLWVRPELETVARMRHACEVNQSARPGSLLVNARWIPEGQPELSPRPAVGILGDEIVFIHCDEILAPKMNSGVVLDEAALATALESTPRVPAKGWVMQFPWDLIEFNGDMLTLQWRKADGAILGEVHGGSHLLNRKYIHIGSGSIIDPGAVIDAREGPVYVGDHVTIMSNAVIQGPTFIGEGTTINAGAWIRTNVSIGPSCKIGGEVGASIFHALANKQHHGFCGHSYVAEWVNIGAGTTTSNLKNTYGSVRVPLCGVRVDSGETFVGSVIGDFAKTGINQSLSTGSVVGVGTSIATSSIPGAFVPSFRFITDQRNEAYDIERALAVAKKTMARRKIELSSAEESYFRKLPAICARHESV